MHDVRTHTVATIQPVLPRHAAAPMHFDAGAVQGQGASAAAVRFLAAWEANAVSNKLQLCQSRIYACRERWMPIRCAKMVPKSRASERDDTYDDEIIFTTIRGFLTELSFTDQWVSKDVRRAAKLKGYVRFFSDGERVYCFVKDDPKDKGFADLPYRLQGGHVRTRECASVRCNVARGDVKIHAR